jgi:type IV pilus assembly protein PilY1
MNIPLRTKAGWIVAGAVLLALIPFCGPNKAHAQAMADYTSIPPFIADAVPPNVLLLMDNSGSMNTSAFHENGEAYVPTKEYNGYFAPDKCYSYGSNKFTPVADKATTGNPCVAAAPWLGHFLNYMAMTRLEITKWVMMGGKCAPRAVLTGNCYPGGTMVLETAENVGDIVMDGTGITPYGSRCFTRNGDDLSVYSGTSCSGGNTDFKLKADVALEPNGVIQAVGTKARFGLMQFKSAGDGGKILAEVGGNPVDMINGIENTDASTYTPLAESLYEATRYFAQVVPAFANSDYSYNVTSKDPYYFKSPDWSNNSPGEYVNCCKSFIMVFTDGEPTQDTNVPTSLRDYAHAHHGAHCTSTTTTTCVGHKTDYASSGNHYLDDVAFYAHTTDLRQTTLPVLNETGKDLTGFQNITVYTFYAFGQAIGREILQTTAKTGGFEDRNGNNQPDLVEEYDKVNNYTGTAGADGLPDTYFESADANDLRDRLVSAITSILQRSASGTAVSVLATSSTGDGTLYQSFFYPLTYEGAREVKWIGYTQGLFLDTFGNLREDTLISGVADGRLIYNQDKIIRTRVDSENNVLVDRYTDGDGDGKADNVTPDETVQLREMQGIWEAGKRLALTDPANRVLLTWVDLDNDGLVDSGEQLSFTTANSATLSPYLRAGAAPYTADNIINFIRGTQVTGLRDRELSVNGSLVVWKYGDPIHSTPTIVGPPKERFDLLYGDATYTPFFQLYKTRRQVAYVGSNDGMLHAFNSGFYHRGDDPSVGSPGVEHGWYTKNPTDNSSGQALGDELWGFIPYQLLPHLKWLTQADYSHVYYVDLKPKVTDVKIFTADADHPNGWGTILIGGFRMGGSCGACVGATGAPTMTVTISGTPRNFYTAYFVLDITNPEVAPKLLWSFSSSDLVLSTSYPTVVRTSPAADAKTDHTNAQWFVVFGSGVAGYGGEAKQASKLFAVNLITGPGAANSLVTPMLLGSSDSFKKSFMADPITLDQNLDYRSDIVYAGRTIDPNDSNGTEPARGIWSGKMYRLTMGACASAPCSTSTWGIANGSNRQPTEILNTFPPSGTTFYMGPIVSAPTVTLDDAGNTWIFFGTGRYFSPADKTNANTQYFFGIKDSVMSPGACGQTSDTNCHDNDLVNVSSAQICVLNVGTCGGATNQVTGVTGVTTFSSGSGTTSLIGLVKSKDGWYTTLPAARERVLSNPTLIGGIAFFPSFIPDNNICAATGSSNLYALFYLTGSAYTESIIGLTPSGSNQIVNRSMSLGTGLAAQMAIHLGSQGSGGGGGGGGGGGCQSGMGGFINTSSGNIAQTCANSAYSMRSRYVAWINQRE